MATKKDINMSRWLDDHIDIDNRRIILSEDVDEFTVCDIISGLFTMIDKNAEKPIDFYVSSFGGSVYDGLALYDYLRSLNVQIRTHALGKVMSMGLILFLAGDERHCFEHCTFMAHEVSGGAIGKSSGLTVEAAEAERLNEALVQIIADRTTKSKKWWKDEIKYTDKYYDKDKAIKLGIVTEK